MDEVAIDTALLQQQDFIGDDICIAMSGDKAVIVYDGTGLLIPWPISLTVEQFYSARIVWG